MYLDNTATTKPRQEVIDAMMPYFTEKWYNPSSLYTPAHLVKMDVIAAREKIARFINAEPDEIIFTSGASESNALALRGSGADWLVISDMEHKSINAFYYDSEQLGYFKEVVQMPVDRYGRVSEHDLKIAIKELREEEAKNGNPDCKFIYSEYLCNNEIGTINRIKSFTDGTLYHVDATQAFGKIPIDVKQMNVDFLSASGHKIGCPKGIGILYVKRGTKVNPLILGSQMDGLRGGTENVPYIIGMAKAVECCNLNHNIDMVVKFWHFVSQVIKRKIGKINGSLHERMNDIISLTISENVHGEALVYWLSRKGFYISAGSACNAGSGEPSKALRAIGLSEDEALRTIRVTLFEEMTNEDIDSFLDALQEGIEALKTIRR